MGRREAMKDRILKTVPVPEEGLFVPPTLIRIDAIEELRQEWFGPLLHVTTWQGGDLAETVRRVHASGFGLTMGLHRSEERRVGKEGVRSVRSLVLPYPLKKKDRVITTTANKQ